MKGETTVDERINARLKWLDKVLTFYQQRFTNLTYEELICELIADATYLATYFGTDLEKEIEETVHDVRKYFPDVP